MKPTVSILIPCHNAAQWVGNAIDSSLAQTWPAIEVIVIDDGSTDDSPAVLSSYADRAKIICRQNRGGNPTRNELLALAAGDWVQFLDADDYLLPDKLAHQVACITSEPAARAVYAPLVIEHHDGTASPTSSIWDPHDSEGDHDPWAYHLGWSLTQTGGALFHRQTLLAAGGWDEQQPCCQDNEVFFRLLKANTHFVRCPHPDAVYRRFNTGSVSTGNQQRLLREILKLLDAGEAFLREHNCLTPRRLHATNQFRLNLARKEWTRDRASASAIMRRIHSSDPRFRPTAAEFAPASYCKAYRLLGFHGAEWLSMLKRSCLRK